MTPLLAARRIRSSALEDERVPCILEADKSSKEYRKNWARLIQKIGACPKCRGIMQIISFIEDREVIQTILKHHPHYPWDAYLQS
ncbi:MAG: hypothetical protein MUP68_16645 [Deltaproteobacteria bacterium]|nr:hypothetical protein [Deltaproteobacteria bacterium]